MRVLPDPIYFDWDEGNIDKNFKKHKVSNKEIEEVFINSQKKFTFEDQTHSATEKRHGIFGKTDDGKFLSIVFTIRKEKVRVVTARPMSRKERRSYEKIKTNSNI